MAIKCASCGSVSTQTGLGNNYQCLDCGALTDFEGNVAEGGLDQRGREILEEQLAAGTRGPNLVGNLADLQRAGAAIATGQGSGLESGVELPAGVTEEAAEASGDEVTTTKSKKAAKKK